MRCKNCGKEISQGEPFCSICGTENKSLNSDSACTLEKESHPKNKELHMLRFLITCTLCVVGSYLLVYVPIAKCLDIAKNLTYSSSFDMQLLSQPNYLSVVAQIYQKLSWLWVFVGLSILVIIVNIIAVIKRRRHHWANVITLVLSCVFILSSAFFGITYTTTVSYTDSAPSGSNTTIEGSVNDKPIEFFDSEYITFYATEEDFRYNIEDGEVTIWDYIHQKRYTEKHNLVIPEEIEGHPVTRITNHTFDGYALTGVYIPENVQYIGMGAFDSCLSLQRVFIPSTTIDIVISAFGNCPKLEAIHVSENNNEYRSLDGVLYNKDLTTLFWCPQGKNKLLIPNSVTTIVGCHELDKIKNIVIPESVTTIGEDAFSGSDGITSITIPASVVDLGKFAFANCGQLEEVVFNAPVISERCFQSCDNLRSVVLSDSVTAIEYGAFIDCIRLKEIVIPDSVTSISYWAFGDYVTIKCNKGSYADEFAGLNDMAVVYLTSDSPIEQEQENITAKQAKKIAEDLIAAYHQYSTIGVCCDIEYSDADMSGYLSQSQKENYWNQQYRLDCCRSVTEVREHILETMDADLATNFSEENLFADDDGNLYVLVTPMGAAGYGEIAVIEYSENRIVAEAPLQDIDGELGFCDVFTIVKHGDNYIIDSVSR